MAGGGLYDPLGLDRPKPVRRGFWPSPLVVILAMMGAGLVAILVLASIRDDGDRGTPRVISPIEHVAAPQKPVVPPPLPEAPSPPVAVPTAASGLPAPNADQDVEIENGVRIIRPKRDDRPPDSRTIPVSGASTMGSPSR